MTETQTPGEHAYAAFWQVQRKGGHHHWPPPFAQLPARTRQAWDAAAQAVRAPRLTDQAAQLHHLIDYVVEHAPQAYLDKVHIWLTDLSGIVHQEHHAPPLEEKAHA